MTSIYMYAYMYIHPPRPRHASCSSSSGARAFAGRVVFAANAVWCVQKKETNNERDDCDVCAEIKIYRHSACDSWRRGFCVGAGLGQV